MKKEIIIDRSKWRTGADSCNSTGTGSTLLLNDEGYKCCLGFVTQQATKKAIKNKLSPASCGYNVPDLTINGANTTLTSEAMRINDSVKTTPEEKEKALKKLFKNNSRYKLKFVGKYSCKKT